MKKKSSAENDKIILQFLGKLKPIIYLIIGQWLGRDYHICRILAKKVGFENCVKSLLLKLSIMCSIPSF